jgi:hypothetical protein
MRNRLLFVVLFLLLSDKNFISRQSPQRNAIKSDPHIAPGRVVTQGQNISPQGKEGLLSYRLEEVDLQDPVDVRFGGKMHHLNSVLRLTVTGESSEGAHTIWIDDAALPRVFGLGRNGIGVFIYDRSIVRNGAEISISDGKQVVTLPERLRVPDQFAAGFEKNEEANQIIAIHSGVKGVGSLPPQRIIQITMQTERAFPVRNAALELQIGKQFFMYGLETDTTGHFLTLTLPANTFAQLKDGSDVLAFYNTPDRSGGGGADVWYFGSLKKNLLDR